jgi:hypothetical protein
MRHRRYDYPNHRHYQWLSGIAKSGGGLEDRYYSAWQLFHSSWRCYYRTGNRNRRGNDIRNATLRRCILLLNGSSG